jgi:hypothetical protein
VNYEVNEGHCEYSPWERIHTLIFLINYLHLHQTTFETAYLSENVMN